MTDIELIHKAQAGDSEAFAQLYDLYVKRIYAYVFVRVRHKEAAEDITSVTFMKALEKLNTFQNEVSYIAWLFTIARNTLIDHIRREKPKNSMRSIIPRIQMLELEKFHSAASFTSSVTTSWKRPRRSIFGFDRAARCD